MHTHTHTHTHTHHTHTHTHTHTHKHTHTHTHTHKYTTHTHTHTHTRTSYAMFFNLIRMSSKATTTSSGSVASFALSPRASLAKDSYRRINSQIQTTPEQPCTQGPANVHVPLPSLSSCAHQGGYDCQQALEEEVVCGTYVHMGSCTHTHTHTHTHTQTHTHTHTHAHSMWTRRLPRISAAFSLSSWLLYTSFDVMALHSLRPVSSSREIASKMFKVPILYVLSSH